MISADLHLHEYIQTNALSAEDPPLLDKACFLSQQREEVSLIVPLKQSRKHSCWDKSKMHRSFEDSEQTSLCQMCHSEPAGFKAGSHLGGGLRALAFLHSLCHILLPLSLSLSTHTVLSPFLLVSLLSLSVRVGLKYQPE